MCFRNARCPLKDGTCSSFLVALRLALMCLITVFSAKIQFGTDELECVAKCSGEKIAIFFNLGNKQVDKMIMHNNIQSMLVLGVSIGFILFANVDNTKPNKFGFGLVIRF